MFFYFRECSFELILPIYVCFTHQELFIKFADEVSPQQQELLDARLDPKMLRAQLESHAKPDIVLKVN